MSGVVQLNAVRPQAGPRQPKERRSGQQGAASGVCPLDTAEPGSLVPSSVTQASRGEGLGTVANQER
jgi:hypothetical protein